MIAEGRVSVDGEVVSQMGRRIDPETAVVRVDGARVQLRDDVVHLALNKPRGMLSAMSDDRGRPCVGDLVAGKDDRLFHVGRLDADTEGLLLLTNDGELGHRLMHPSFEVPKTYLAEVPGPIPRELGRRLREGVQLADGPVRVDSFKVVDSFAGKAMVELVLHEGRKHVVRRLLDEVGHPVRRLVRTAIAGVQLGPQRPGSLRALSQPELGSLYEAGDLCERQWGRSVRPAPGLAAAGVADVAAQAADWRSRNTRSASSACRSNCISPLITSMIRRSAPITKVTRLVWIGISLRQTPSSLATAPPSSDSSG
jgi:23S rRNA pseudouridine2605 synthase